MTTLKHFLKDTIERVRRTFHMRAKPPLYGFPWNQAEANPLMDRGLLTMIAFDNDDQPHVIGTAFVIQNGITAIALTAAHNLDHVRNLQNEQWQRHQTMPLDFRPEMPPLDIDRKRLRLVLRDGDHVEACIVERAAYDKTSDIAILFISKQIQDGKPVGSADFRLESVIPVVGDLVCTLAYAHEKASDVPEHQFPAFRFGRAPILRIGTVIARHLEGHILCRGPCIETTIPVAGGMSGGPALYFGKEGAIRVFGLVSSDPEATEEEKNNRDRAGASIIALIPCEVAPGEGASYSLKLSLKCATFTGEGDPGTHPTMSASRYFVSGTWGTPSSCGNRAA